MVSPWVAVWDLQFPEPVFTVNSLANKTHSSFKEGSLLAWESSVEGSWVLCVLRKEECLGRGKPTFPKDSVSIRHGDPDVSHCTSSPGAGRSTTPVHTYHTLLGKLVVQKKHQPHSFPVRLASVSGKHAVLNQLIPPGDMGDLHKYTLTDGVQQEGSPGEERFSAFLSCRNNCCRFSPEG